MAVATPGKPGIRDTGIRYLFTAFLCSPAVVPVACLGLGARRGGGGRCRIRTYDFHRVKVTLYR
jgi:hypothetical protein